MIAVYIFAAIAALILFISLIAYLKAFYHPPRSRKKSPYLPGKEQYDRVKDKTSALYNEMAALPCERIQIAADDGTALFASYYHVQDGAPLQIQCHGYHGSGLRDFCGGNKLARESGHNTLVIDQRAHGESGSRTITFGVRERYDCLQWTRYAAERFGKDAPIILSGVSMGAASVLMASALDLPENVRGIIADSPYNAPTAIIRKVCRDMHLPPALTMPFVRLGARIFGGFDPDSASAVEAVAHTKVPILIIHGEDDRFVPCEMSAEIRAANPKMVRRETFPGAGHGLSYIIDTGRYEKIVEAFLRECLG